jgi:hypothetical protein
MKSDITEADIGGVSTATNIDRGIGRGDVTVAGASGPGAVDTRLTGITGGSGGGSYTSGV